MDELFRCENQAYPPALSDGGSLGLGTTCLDEILDTRSGTPTATGVVIEGVAIV